MADSVYCPRCGTARVPGQGFCTKCGMRFDDLSAGGAVPPPPPPASPPQYPSYQQPAPPPAYQQPAYQQQPPPSIEQTLSYQPPAPAPAARRGSVRMGSASVRVLSLVGAVLVVLGALLPWVSIEGAGSSNGFDIPFQFLFDPQGTTGTGGFSIGLVLLVVGIGGGILTFLPATGGIRRAAGMVAIIVAIVFVVQLVQLFEGASFADIMTDAVSFGVYTTLVGGFLLAATK